jgi:hypothetical protein
MIAEFSIVASGAGWHPDAGYSGRAELSARWLVIDYSEIEGDSIGEGTD